MSQAEKGADGYGSLTGSNQAARHQVDGADVVGVEGVAEAKGVGEHGGRDHFGEVVQGDADAGPDEAVDEDEEGDEVEGGAGDVGERWWEPEMGEFEAGHLGGGADGGGELGSELRLIVDGEDGCRSRDICMSRRRIRCSPVAGD